MQQLQPKLVLLDVGDHVDNKRVITKDKINKRFDQRVEEARIRTALEEGVDLIKDATNQTVRTTSLLEGAQAMGPKELGDTVNHRASTIEEAKVSLRNAITYLEVTLEHLENL